MYNLLDEKWIPVLWADGKYSRVGIKSALTEAHRIRQIAAGNPMDRMAVLRFLLALLYWCRGNPPSTRATIARFPEEWFSKLEENRKYFELLGEGNRFYQYKKKDDTRKLSVNYLIHEIPTGTNTWHFLHARDGKNGLCPACCALGLLRLPLFTTSGGKGKSPGINLKPPVYVAPTGNTLLETMRLFWEPAESIETKGIPAWENPELKLPAYGEVPLLTGLTWLPRRVWLDEPSLFEASCISCGRTEPLIRLAVFGGLGSAKTDSEQPRIWTDPQIAHQQVKKKLGVSSSKLYAADALSSPTAASEQWARLIAFNRRKNKQWAVGFATVKNDKYLEVWEDKIPPAKIETDGAAFEDWKKGGDRLAERPLFKRNNSDRNIAVQSALASIRAQVESKVSNRLGELLTGDEKAWQEAAEEYKPMMELIAESLAPGCTTEALKMRRGIAEMLPDINSLTKPAAPETKEGGEK
jgi:CRISPR type I-E-associated protein CasA/Cse1